MSLHSIVSCYYNTLFIISFKTTILHYFTNRKNLNLQKSFHQTKRNTNTYRQNFFSSLLPFLKVVMKGVCLSVTSGPEVCEYVPVYINKACTATITYKREHDAVLSVFFSHLHTVIDLEKKRGNIVDRMLILYSKVKKERE